jgi:hypothetical protein
VPLAIRALTKLVVPILDALEAVAGKLPATVDVFVIVGAVLIATGKYTIV